MSLLLLDVDHFKRFNDCYGHLAGDACLRAISAQLSALAHRSGDLAVRYGGEEFLLLLPNTSAEGALCVAERVLELIENLFIPHRDSHCAAVVTVSIGVATTPRGDGAEGSTFDVESLLAHADAALYRAKDNGRNRVAG